MQRIEQQEGIPTMQAPRESTHLLRRGGRGGYQEYFDRGFGKVQNTDFEPLHRLDG